MTQLTKPREMQGNLEPATEPIGLFHAWWRGDALPVLPPIPGLVLTPATDISALAAFAGVDASTISDRLDRGHEPWQAAINSRVVGYGWATANDLTIGELGLEVSLQPGSRYLWDFFTMPEWRGQGIYPRLLQAIVAHESSAERFWIGHDLANVASAHGIAKAGFGEVGAVYRLPSGALAMTCLGAWDRAVAASAQFGVKIVDHVSAGIS
jgi:GNAT superfamily N-acetyltransferase